MSETDKLPPALLKFAGTPAEVGVQIWNRMCNPAVRAASHMTANELVQLYAGIMSAALGSMAVDFGHANASSMVRQLVDSFEAVADELGGAMTQ
jgi:hypothetical protein